MKTVVSLLLLALCASALIADSALSTEEQERNANYLQIGGEPFVWPSRARPELRVTRDELRIEAHALPVIRMSGAGYNWIMDQQGGWVVTGNAEGRYSVCFQHRHSPGLSFGISVFREGEFLPDTELDVLARYVKGLVRGAPKGVDIAIVEGPYERQGFLRSTLIGEFPRSIRYRIHDHTNQRVLEREEFFLRKDGRLVVVTYENTPQLFERSRGAVVQLLGSVADTQAAE